MTFPVPVTMTPCSSPCRSPCRRHCMSESQDLKAPDCLQWAENIREMRCRTEQAADEGKEADGYAMRKYISTRRGAAFGVLCLLLCISPSLFVQVTKPCCHWLLSFGFRSLRSLLLRNHVAASQT